VTIDGISLTVNRVDESGFSVNVIPHTASLTTLSAKRPGDEVNIETDIIGKYLEHLVSARGAGESGGITFDLLAKNGFM
jgi:riboflavin synthase